MYLIATLELKYGKAAEFMELVPTIKAAMERCGCRLIHAMVPVTGRLFNLIHIWELPSVDALDAIAFDDEFLAILPILNQVVAQETMVFTKDAPYSPALAS